MHRGQRGMCLCTPHAVRGAECVDLCARVPQRARGALLCALRNIARRPKGEAETAPRAARHVPLHSARRKECGTRCFARPRNTTRRPKGKAETAPRQKKGCHRIAASEAPPPAAQAEKQNTRD